MRFNGSDYEPIQDDKRLSAQHDRIKHLMLDQGWRTLREISESTQDPEASISAQLRHLRKKRFGSWVLEKRPRGQRSEGLFEYRLMPPGYASEHVVEIKKNKYRRALEVVWRKFPGCRVAIREELDKK